MEWHTHNIFLTRRLHTCQSQPQCRAYWWWGHLRKGAGVWEENVWEAAINQPAKQEGVPVQQRPGCVETLWGGPAPEVWTDGFGGGAPEGFLGREKSWCSRLAESTTEEGGGDMCVGETVLSCFFPSFCLSRVCCWTADHDYKKAIMICLTERISESASNQQNEFQSKLREWHAPCYCNKRWNVNSPLSHYASIIHSFVVGTSNKTAITGGENMKALNWISIKRFTEV